MTQLGLSVRLVCNEHGCLDWSPKIFSDSQNRNIFNSGCRHWQNIQLQKESRSGWYLLGANNLLKLSGSARCNCGRSFSFQCQSYWGWSRGDQKKETTTCNDCGSTVYLLSGEDGHWSNAVRPTGWIREIVNRSITEATGAGILRMRFNLDNFAHCNVECLDIYAVNGILPGVVERLSFLAGSKAEHHFIVLHTSTIFFLLQWGGQGRQGVGLYDIILEEYPSLDAAKAGGCRNISANKPWQEKSASPRGTVTVQDVADFLRTEVSTVYELTNRNCQTLAAEVFKRFS